MLAVASTGDSSMFLAAKIAITRLATQLRESTGDKENKLAGSSLPWRRSQVLRYGHACSQVSAKSVKQSSASWQPHLRLALRHLFWKLRMAISMLSEWLKLATHKDCWSLKTCPLYWHPSIWYSQLIATPKVWLASLRSYQVSGSHRCLPRKSIQPFSAWTMRYLSLLRDEPLLSSLNLHSQFNRDLT